MVNYEEFWKNLRDGKWRRISQHRSFMIRTGRIILELYIAYVSVVLVLLFAKYQFPDLSSDFINILSTMFGFAISVIAIAVSVNSYYIQQIGKAEIITYLGKMELEQQKDIITFINIGETVIFKQLSLVAFEEVKGIRSRFSTIPILDIHDTTTIFYGNHILPKNEIFMVPEKMIKDGLNRLKIGIENEKGVKKLANLKIALFAYDETYEVTKDAFGETSLIADINMGNYSDFLKYLNGELDDFPNSVRTHIAVKQSELEKMGKGQKGYAEIVRELPPNTFNIDYEILKKLALIEQAIKELKTNKKKK